MNITLNASYFYYGLPDGGPNTIYFNESSIIRNYCSQYSNMIVFFIIGYVLAFLIFVLLWKYQRISQEQYFEWSGILFRNFIAVGLLVLFYVLFQRWG